jgi:hypothetical protein
MLILFDHGTPKDLARALSGHMVITAQSREWDRLPNGALLKAAEEAAGFRQRGRQHVLSHFLTLVSARLRQLLNFRMLSAIAGAARSRGDIVRISLTGLRQTGS